MKNARLKRYEIHIPHHREKVEMLVCQNFLKTQYIIVIPVINWGFKFNIELPYEEIKKDMHNALRVYNYIPSSEENLIMDVLNTIFNDSFEDAEKQNKQ